jgi:hypothetical protein
MLDVLFIEYLTFRKFEDTLKALQWPVPLKPPYNIQTKEHVKHFEQAFSDLLLLQLP